MKWTQRKTGRTVTHLKFTFDHKENIQPKPPRKGIASDHIRGVSREEIEHLAKPGETWDQASIRIAKEKKHT